MGHFRKSSGTKTVVFRGKHRYEHWYRDNQVYFITARCRAKFAAFASEQAKGIFWHRFEHYALEHGFVPWVTTLLDNHYHTLGYLAVGEQLGPMMRKIHGSVAKWVNDLLPMRHLPFWREAGHRDYFDGCLRDARQYRLAYRYTLTQARRHGLTPDWRTYPHTRVRVELEEGLKLALEKQAFMEGVPYKRYMH